MNWNNLAVCCFATGAFLGVMGAVFYIVFDIRHALFIIRGKPIPEKRVRQAERKKENRRVSKLSQETDREVYTTKITDTLCQTQLLTEGDSRSDGRWEEMNFHVVKEIQSGGEIC